MVTEMFKNWIILTIIMVAIQTYQTIFTGLEKYLQKKLKRDYELSPSAPFVIGGADIAAIAMAASQTSELYSVAKEAMPHLPENRRNETGDNLSKNDKPQAGTTDKSKTTENNSNPYGAYGQIYEKYKDKLYGIKSRLQQIYRDSIEKLSKLRSLNEGKVSNALKRIPYNPLKKTNLTEKVEKFSRYLRSKKYQADRPKYIGGLPITYNKQQEEGDLEELLKAA